VRFAPEQVHTSAAYGKFRIEGEADLSITNIECDGYQSVEWHESSIDEKGIMHMKKASYPHPVSAGKDYTFVRGGDHLMLIGRNRNIKEGERLLLTFYFSDNSKKLISAKVAK